MGGARFCKVSRNSEIQLAIDRRSLFLAGTGAEVQFTGLAGSEAGLKKNTCLGMKLSIVPTV